MVIWDDRVREYHLEDTDNNTLVQIVMKIQDKTGNVDYINRRNLNFILDELYERGKIGYFTYMKCRIFRRKLQWKDTSWV